MADNKIGGLPVSEGDKLVGIITETDVFKILVELLGARTPGQRVTIRVTEGKGVLARLTQALSDLGANIISVVTYAGANASERLIMVKLSDAGSTAVRGALAGLGVEVVDFRGE
jgi:acetoin utilization protein AcuB